MMISPEAYYVPWKLGLGAQLPLPVRLSCGLLVAVRCAQHPCAARGAVLPVELLVLFWLVNKGWSVAEPP